MDEDKVAGLEAQAADMTAEMKAKYSKEVKPADFDIHRVSWECEGEYVTITIQYENSVSGRRGERTLRVQLGGVWASEVEDDGG